MINRVFMRLMQTYEFIKHNGPLSLLHEIFYCNRVAIVVEKNLNEFDSAKEDPEDYPVKMIELRPDMLTNRNFYYSVNNRYLKAVHYFKMGYGGYAIVKNEKIIGDIWFYKPEKVNCHHCHPDCNWLQITCAEDQVYTFDMFLSPDERGSNLASFLQRGALKALRKEGFSKAYGYYWGDNMPALWVHRLGKWQEIKRLKVNRFVFFKKVLA